MTTLTDRQLETLQAVEFQSNRETLNSLDIDWLLDQGYIGTAWSDYGLVISAKGVDYLDENC